MKGEESNALTLGAELGAMFGKGGRRDFHVYQDKDGEGRRKIEITVNECPPVSETDGESLAQTAARFLRDTEQRNGSHSFNGWTVSECRYSEDYGDGEPRNYSLTVVLLESPMYGEKQE